MAEPAVPVVREGAEGGVDRAVWALPVDTMGRTALMDGVDLTVHMAVAEISPSRTIRKLSPT